jgi:hypothetical protein
MYAFGTLPSVGNMSIAGAVWGAALAAALAIRQPHLPSRFARATRLAAGAILAAAIIGGMY